MAIGKKRKLDSATAKHLKNVSSRTIASVVKKMVAQHEAQKPIKSLERKLKRKDKQMAELVASHKQQLKKKKVKPQAKVVAAAPEEPKESVTDKMKNLAREYRDWTSKHGHMDPKRWYDKKAAGLISIAGLLPFIKAH